MMKLVFQVLGRAVEAESEKTPLRGRFLDKLYSLSTSVNGRGSTRKP